MALVNSFLRASHVLFPKHIKAKALCVHMWEGSPFSTNTACAEYFLLSGFAFCGYWCYYLVLPLLRYCPLKYTRISPQLFIVKTEAGCRKAVTTAGSRQLQKILQRRIACPIDSTIPWLTFYNRCSCREENVLHILSSVKWKHFGGEIPYISWLIAKFALKLFSERIESFHTIIIYGRVSLQRI